MALIFFNVDDNHSYGCFVSIVNFENIDYNKNVDDKFCFDKMVESLLSETV